MSGGKMLVPHWDAVTALEAYRGEREGVRRAHLQVIWLLLSGEAASAVARVTGFSLRWVDKLVARWNAEGPAGLGDRRLLKKPRRHGGCGHCRSARPRGRTVGLRRASPRPEAARPAGLGQARPTPRGGQHAQVQMALSLRFCAAGDRRGRVVAGQ